MSNQWYRQYSEFAFDPKVQSMTEAMQRRLTMLFCLRCSDLLQKLNEEEIAFSLRISDQELAETKAIFIQKGFIDDQWNVCKWDERQYITDNSNERVKKYREKRKSMGLSANGYTKHSVTVTQRDGHACVYCGSVENLCIDHILPVAQNGNDDIENLACACKACNSGKAGRTPEEAGYSFKNAECEKRWQQWLVRRVTVTATPPDTEQIQNRTEKKVSKQQRGSRFALTVMPDDWRVFCLKERPELDPEKLFAEFGDYWRGIPGQRGCKLDWFGTWRNRVREAPQPRGQPRNQPFQITTFDQKQALEEFFAHAEPRSV